MPFIDQISSCKSLSIVGMEKNTGKTECLNYILRQLPQGVRVAVTSIGVDGESIDRVTGTPKPEIILKEGCVFGTSERDYKGRKIVSKLLNVSEISTATGRVVTAQALSEGKVRLSGASSTSGLQRWINSLNDIDLTIIDGALSRKSSASPAVSEAMILSTGAALSANMETLVRKTAFMVEMINLPKTKVEEVVEVDAFVSEELPKGGQFYVKGALTDSFLKRLADEVEGVVAVVMDFTRVFCKPETYRYFVKRGGKLEVKQRSKLLAICVNPTSPNGMVLNSELLCQKIKEATKVKTYDIFKFSNK